MRKFTYYFVHKIQRVEAEWNEFKGDECDCIYNIKSKQFDCELAVFSNYAYRTTKLQLARQKLKELNDPDAKIGKLICTLKENIDE